MIKLRIPILILLLLVIISCTIIIFADQRSTTEEVIVSKPVLTLYVKEETGTGEFREDVVTTTKVDTITELYENLELAQYIMENSINENIVEVIELPMESNNQTQQITNIIEDTTELSTTTSTTCGFTEDEIDMITSVVMHEVGGLYGSNSSVTITYANGYSETYYGTCLIHKIHAQVLINQYHSSLFPSSLSRCISLYWDAGLTNTNYYNKNNSTWQHCRADVLDVLTSGGNLPNNVFGATCDPYFAQRYSGYSLYASVYWNTGWYSGTFYYYQYNG